MSDEEVQDRPKKGTAQLGRRGRVWRKKQPIHDFCSPVMTGSATSWTIPVPGWPKLRDAQRLLLPEVQIHSASQSWCRGMRKRAPSGLPTGTFDVSPMSKVPGTPRSEKLQQPPALRFGAGWFSGTPSMPKCDCTDSFHHLPQERQFWWKSTMMPIQRATSSLTPCEGGGPFEFVYMGPGPVLRGFFARAVWSGKSNSALAKRMHLAGTSVACCPQTSEHVTWIIFRVFVATNCHTNKN